MAIPLLQRGLRFVVCFGVFLVFAAGMTVSAQQQGARPQITQPIENLRSVVLAGNVRPRPAAAQDLGAAPADMPTGRMLLLLKRPAAQEAALRRYIQEEHSRSSPSYHRWLTPVQIGAQFGPADSDIAMVVSWLQAQGFVIHQISPAKTAIEFSGSVGQVASAFATGVHSFRVNGESHIANIADPRIPAALAPAVTGISPLNDFRPRALHTAPIARTAAPAPGHPRAIAIQSREGAPASDLTFPTSASENFYGVTPGDFAIIYDTPNPSLDTKYAGSLSLTGSGVAIGIAGDSNVDLANVANYRKLFGLPPLTPTVVVDGNDPGVNGDAVEALLDLEAASAVAPNAGLTLYIAGNTTFQSGLFLAIQRALNDNTVDILNVSFGGCEANQGQSGNSELNGFWEQAAAQGISVTVSTGDSGSAGCDNPNTQAAATQGLQVNGIASTPYNIAVGGTDFNQTAANESQYWNSGNSSNGASALSYIPEIPWNDSTSTIGPSSGNAPQLNSKGQTNISAAGGGVSGCLTATMSSSGHIASCIGAYAKPTWQTGFGTSTARELPDVSLFAANGFHSAAWVLCASDLGADTSTTDCTPDVSGNYNFQLIGGTSASSPAFAGVLALVMQSLQNAGAGAASNRLGQANTTLYALSQQFPATFHDVAAGNIAVYCATGSLNCGSNNFLSSYDAGVGYDEATGLGSVDVAQLVQDWSKVDFKATTTSLAVNGSATPITLQHGAPVKIAVAVAGLGGTPTGTVALEAGNAGTITAGSSGAAAVLPLNNGSASAANIYLPGSGAASYTLTANYGGDTNYEPSTSNGIQVTVTPEPSTLNLTILKFPNGSTAGQTVTGSVPYGTYVSVAAHPVAASHSAAASQQATGAISFISSNATLNQVGIAIDSSGVAEIPGQTTLAFSPGIYTVSAAYSGDDSYAPSKAAAQSFTVVKNNVTITAAEGSVSGIATVQVAPGSIGGFLSNSGMSLPTGAVTLTGASGATVGSGTLALAKDSSGNPVAQATVMLSGAATGISYAGDANYNAGTLAATLAGTGSFILSASPASLSLASGGAGITTISVTPASGFIGTVALSCNVAGAGQAPICTLAQGSVSIAGAAAATDTLTVSTQSTASAVVRWYSAGGIALAAMFLFGLAGPRRPWQRMLSLLLFFAAIGIAGCGGGSDGSSNSRPPDPVHYTVTVTAKSATITQTSTIAVTVQ